MKNSVNAYSAYLLSAVTFWRHARRSRPMRFNEAEVRVSDAHANNLRLLDRFHNFDRNLRVGRFLVASNVCSTSQERRLAQPIEHELNGESGEQYARHATDHISAGPAEDCDQMLGRSHRAKC